MHKYFNCSLIAILSLVLQSCTIAHFQISDKLHVNTPATNNALCNIRYFISVRANPRQVTRKPQYNDDQLKKDAEAYIRATEAIFVNHGCVVHKVAKSEEANFKIDIMQSPFWSALPQEFLTGISFGAIPSWGTREGEYEFGFTNIELMKEHTYTVDRKSYNHIVLFPVVWINLITRDKFEVYADSLANFLESS